MRGANSWLAVVGTFLVLGSTVGCGGGDGDSAGGGVDLAQGEKLFRQTCATCHGMNGQGVGSLGDPIVGNEFVALSSDADLVKFLIEGRPATHPDNESGVAMPPRGGNPNLTDEDLAAIVAYSRTLN
ncbi:MAG: cytochrome c [Acidobacteria bacterium]|nr:cytochrome c [Acidobacteriota bacterium]